MERYCNMTNQPKNYEMFVQNFFKLTRKHNLKSKNFDYKLNKLLEQYKNVITNDADKLNVYHEISKDLDISFGIKSTNILSKVKNRYLIHRTNSRIFDKITLHFGIDQILSQLSHNNITGVKFYNRLSGEVRDIIIEGLKNGLAVNDIGKSLHACFGRPTNSLELANFQISQVIRRSICGVADDLLFNSPQAYTSKYTADDLNLLRSHLLEALYNERTLHTDGKWHYNKPLAKIKAEQTIENKSSANIGYLKKLINGFATDDTFSLELVNQWIDLHAKSLKISESIDVCMFLLEEAARKNGATGPYHAGLNNSISNFLKSIESKKINKHYNEILTAAITKSKYSRGYILPIIDTFPTLFILSPKSTNLYKHGEIVNALEWCEDFILSHPNKATKSLHLIIEQIRPLHEKQKLQKICTTTNKKITLAL